MRRTAAGVPEKYRVQRDPADRHFMEAGSTKEEWNMVVGTRKIFYPEIAVAATTRARGFGKRGAAWRNVPGIIAHDQPVEGGYITPAAGRGSVYVSRLRKGPAVDNGLAF